ncbi:hypothetical protein [Schinkia azotoformans]|uniref:hypothetical protein n=1 Tax=Schinkia azotoformans TaxID=1454 RepID=UPI002DBBFBD0|nr:hypothetical protein [Schinkia azotoformans]MEC1759886.1 hypothetical protein [Schinkia azotoformans]
MIEHEFKRRSYKMNSHLISYFDELREQIIDKGKWDKDRFHVFNYEAGSGKSKNTFRFLAEMSHEHPYRVLYVQRFIKNNEIINTVETINKLAGKQVADYFASNDTRSNVRKRRATEAQILCISHNMHVRICRGTHPELIEGRDILIIDEYIDLVERISLSTRDIGVMWVSGYKYSKLLRELAENIMESIQGYPSTKMNEMIFIDFKDSKYVEYKKKLPDIARSMGEKDIQKVINKALQILSNGCFYYENGFHTCDLQNDFVMLHSNIILDANAGFDYKYNLSKKFLVRKQPSFFDYSNTKLLHIEVKTGKKQLKKYINLTEKVIETIRLEQKEKSLIITDKENQKNVEERISDYLSIIGYSNEEIDEIMVNKIRVDYFGNLTGINTYRDFNTVVVLKTPYFDYLSYVLTYFYYCTKEGKEIGNIKAFLNEEVEKIRKTTVAGEMYQAIKRINRDNTQEAEIYVATTDQDAIDLIIKQLPNVHYSKSKLVVNQRKKEESKSVSVFEKRVNDLKAFLLTQKEKGVPSIRKKELKSHIGIKDSGNFSKYLNVIQPFLEVHGFLSQGQQILLSESDVNEDISA